MNLSSSHSTTGTTISLQLKDKMVFLNGECGGTIPASTTFHEYDEIDSETGEYFTSKPTIIQIIRELVNHFGGEDLNKIIISDLDNRVKKVMKWANGFLLYHYYNINDAQIATFSTVPFSLEDGRKHGDLGKLEKELERVEKEYDEKDSSNYTELQWNQLTKDYEDNVKFLKDEIVKYIKFVMFFFFNFHYFFFIKIKL
jgi:predicted RND superfamily exporter protein